MVSELVDLGGRIIKLSAMEEKLPSIWETMESIIAINERTQQMMLLFMETMEKEETKRSEIEETLTEAIDRRGIQIEENDQRLSEWLETLEKEEMKRREIEAKKREIEETKKREIELMKYFLEHDS